MKFECFLFVILLITCVSAVDSGSEVLTKSDLSDLTYTKSEIDCRVLYLNGRILDGQDVSVGDVRYNIEDERLEFYDGMEWVAVSYSRSSQSGGSSGGDSTSDDTGSSDVIVDNDTTEDQNASGENLGEENISAESLGEENVSSEDLEGEIINEDLEEKNVSAEKSKEKEKGEKLEEVCKEVCKDECDMEEQCEDVEVCKEKCKTKDGEEVCEEECDMEEQCEDVEVCEEVCEEECGAPKKLFDIRMDLKDTVVEEASDLMAVVTYESFGKVPTAVNSRLEVFDLEGNSLYSRLEYIVVTIEEVRRYNFSDLDLPDGEYEFVFTTLYNVDVRDEFRQRFRVGKKGFWERLWGWFSEVLK